MKAKLEFDEEDALGLRRAINATRAYLVLWDMDQWLRGKLKHEAAGKEMEECREKLWAVMEENGVSFNDLE
jgi:hypothetical protein